MRYRHIISVRTIIDTKNVLHKKGGGGCGLFTVFTFFTKTTMSMITLFLYNLSYSSLCHCFLQIICIMCNKLGQNSQTCDRMTLLPPFFVYFRYLDNLLITSFLNFLNFTFMENIQNCWVQLMMLRTSRIELNWFQ